MAELGALSLRIEALGDKEVLSALNAIENKARTVAGSTDKAVAALTALGIEAKASGGQIVVAAGEVERATQLLAKAGLTANVVSKDQLEAAKAQATADKIRTQGFQQYLATLTQGAKLEATRANSIKQLITLEAALQAELKRANLTLAEQVSLARTLAQVQNGIASGIENTTRATTRSVAVQQAQTQGFQILGRDVVAANGKVSAFGKSGLNAFNALAFGLSQMAATGQASFRSLATSMTSVLAFFGPHGAIAAAVIATGLVLVDFFKRQKKDVTELAALLQRFGDDATARRERDEPVTVSEERLAAVRRGIDANRKAMADLFDIQKRTVQLRDAVVVRPVDQQALARLTAERADLLRKEYEALRQVNEAQVAANKGLDEVKVTTKAVTDAEKERQQAQAVELDALDSLSKSRGLSAVELLRLIALEGDLTSELARGSLTKEREAEVWERITKARKTAATALPAVQVRDITRSTPEPVAPDRITIPPNVAAQLDPNRIRADIERSDRAMAERVAAFNFSETQAALSESLANMLGSSIAFGFAEGLGRGGIGEGFKQMAAELSAGLGSVAIDYGVKAIFTAKAMAAISAWLIANPLAAIGIGIGLVAFGRAIGGRGGASGGGGGGSGGFGSTAPTPISISRLVVDPNAGRRATALSQQTAVSSATNPLSGLRILAVNTPGGEQYLAERVGNYERRRG